MTQEEALEKFEELVSIWPRKDDRFEASKIFVDIILRWGENADKIIQAGNTYLIFTERQFCTKLTNWLKERMFAHWMNPGPEITEAVGISLTFLNVWERIGNDYFPAVENRQRCRRLFARAFENDEYFRKNWKRGLERINTWPDHPTGITVTVEWFCNRTNGTLEKILEGVYEKSFSRKEEFKYSKLTSSEAILQDGGSDEAKEVVEGLSQILQEE